TWCAGPRRAPRNQNCQGSWEPRALPSCPVDDTTSSYPFSSAVTTGPDSSCSAKCHCHWVLYQGTRFFPVPEPGNTNRWPGSILPPSAHSGRPLPSGSPSYPAWTEPSANPPAHNRAPTHGSSLEEDRV